MKLGHLVGWKVMPSKNSLSLPLWGSWSNGEEDPRGVGNAQNYSEGNTTLVLCQPVLRGFSEQWNVPQGRRSLFFLACHGHVST